MKVFKKIMNAVAAVENCILVVSTLLILVLTVGNVFSRKVIHRSWSFTEELVVAVFVLITLMAAALACREGELVNLSLVTDRLPEKLKKPSVILTTVLCIIFTAILFWFGMEKVITQLENGKRTFVLNWPEWIFWSFVPIGSGCMIDLSAIMGFGVSDGLQGIYGNLAQSWNFSTESKRLSPESALIYSFIRCGNSFGMACKSMDFKQNSGFFEIF